MAASDPTSSCSELFATLFRILEKHCQLKSRPSRLADGAMLYPSEAYALYMIGQVPHQNATGLAAALGVTRGAVSQMLKRLEQRGWVAREQGVNGREIAVALTEHGRWVLEELLGTQQQREQALLGELERLPPEHQKAVMGLFSCLEDVYDRLLESRESTSVHPETR